MYITRDWAGSLPSPLDWSSAWLDHLPCDPDTCETSPSALHPYWTCWNLPTLVLGTPGSPLGTLRQDKPLPGVLEPHKYWKIYQVPSIGS